MPMGCVKECSSESTSAIRPGPPEPAGPPGSPQRTPVRRADRPPRPVRPPSPGGTMSALQIHTVVSQPFDENTYVVWREGATTALVFDPGLDPGAILQVLADNELTPAALVLTHGHADHIGGNAALKTVHPHIPIIIGSGDAPLLADPWLNLSAPFGFEVVSPPADRTVNEGDVLDLAGVRMEVLEIPGHSQGHVVYVSREDPVLVIGGDVLFRGSVGRTDFPGGDFSLLKRGIHGKLWPLPGDTVVYPGHGPTTTVGHEKRTNPFVGEGATV